MRPLGLKLLRSAGGRQDPNAYWKRKARPKCGTCERRIRGAHHAKGCKPRK